MTEGASAIADPATRQSPNLGKRVSALRAGIRSAWYRSDLGRRCRRIRAWFRARFVKSRRHHVVYLGTKPGWSDVVERMLRANMVLLCSYIEDECGGADKLDAFTAELRAEPDEHAPEACASQADNQAEATAIYRWWTEQRPAEHARNDAWMHCLYRNRSLTSTPLENGLHRLGFTGELDVSMGTQEERWAFERALHDRDQEMLHRLIDIRRSLWT